MLFELFKSAKPHGRFWNGAVNEDGQTPVKTFDTPLLNSLRTKDTLGIGQDWGQVFRAHLFGTIQNPFVLASFFIEL